MTSGFSAFRTELSRAAIGYRIGFLGPDGTLVRDQKPSVHAGFGIVRDEVTPVPYRDLPITVSAQLRCDGCRGEMRVRPGEQEPRERWRDS